MIITNYDESFRRSEDARAATSAATDSRDVPFPSTKIQPRHRDRLAIVYVRQSSPQQVVQHRESGELQYNLVHQAVALGWPRDRVLVIDEDQAHTATTIEGRLGFQRILAEVALDHVGLILGIQLSRLSRSNKDWHQLLELCGRFGTILADWDGIYDPSDYNDRLLLGLTGIMSEAELHIIHMRLHNGRLNKARRGELLCHSPIGYVRRPSGELALDPDEQVQAVVRLIFDKYDELQTIHGVLRYLADHHIHLGVRPHKGPDQGLLQWRRPSRATLWNMLHHPVYAGAYCYGRRPTDPRRKVPGRPGSGRIVASPEQYTVLLNDRCPAYISWERHQANLRRLADNRARAEARGSPRQGLGLLAGLLICGKCGHRMRVYYPRRSDQPRYECSRLSLSHADPICQGVAGRGLDASISQLVLSVLEPAALELSLAAAVDIEQERRRLDQHWRQRLERARFATDRAARQYHQVEPENRLVARELERCWEQALSEQRGLEEAHDRYRLEHPNVLTPQDHEMIRTLASDIPALWRAPVTAVEDRKTILRQLIDRIVLTSAPESELMDATVHWAGGFTSQHELIRPVRRLEQLRDHEQLLARILELREAGCVAPAIAAQLNAEGWRRPRRPGPFNEFDVRGILSRRGYARTRPRGDMAAYQLGAGEWWFTDLASHLGMSSKTLYNWVRRGWVHARKLPGTTGRWIIWADEPELERLHRLLHRPRGWGNDPPPATMSSPTARPQS